MKKLILMGVVFAMMAADSQAFIFTSIGRAIQRSREKERRVKLAIRMMDGSMPEVRAGVDVLAVSRYLMDDSQDKEPFFNWPTILIGAGETVLWSYLLYEADVFGGGSSSAGVHFEQSTADGHNTIFIWETPGEGGGGESEGGEE